MLLEPKPVNTMEMTEEQCRNVLLNYAASVYFCDCCVAPITKCDHKGNSCYLNSIAKQGTADEVFAAVRELAGGESE